MTFLIPSCCRKPNVIDPAPNHTWDDPFQGFFSALANVPTSVTESSAFTEARLDWKETKEAHVFTVELPGVKKEEVRVEVEDGSILRIRGERSKEEEGKHDKWHRIERSSGKFLRRFRLPENAKVDEVTAHMENGVLTVTVPKAEEKKLANLTIPSVSC